jgi:putative hydrolase of the HAD superfamily
MTCPQVIFFDAVGTLFGVRGSVGEVYGKIAWRYGVDAPTEVLNQAFYQSFKAAESPAFPGRNIAEIPQLEFAWWGTIAEQTFKRANVLNQFSDFSKFFAELYHHFETAEPWILYADVVPTLKKLRDHGTTLGVLSNFDSRLHAVLKALDLTDFFSSVTLSTEVGAAKPSPQIFQAALNKHDCLAELAWHVGDSLEEDFKAAKAAGLRGIWLDRKQNSQQTERTLL